LDTGAIELLKLVKIAVGVAKDECSKYQSSGFWGVKYSGIGKGEFCPYAGISAGISLTKLKVMFGFILNCVLSVSLKKWCKFHKVPLVYPKPQPKNRAVPVLLENLRFYQAPFW